MGQKKISWFNTLLWWSGTISFVLVGIWLVQHNPEDEYLRRLQAAVIFLFVANVGYWFRHK